MSESGSALAESVRLLWLDMVSLPWICSSVRKDPTPTISSAMRNSVVSVTRGRLAQEDLKTRIRSKSASVDCKGDIVSLQRA